MNTYIDPFVYQRAPTGLESASLVGPAGFVASGGSIAGATSLPLATPLTSDTLGVGSRVTIFEGASSEVVTLTAVPSVANTVLTVTPLQYAHTGVAVWCGDGPGGSLADVIVRASKRLENKCQQALFAVSYTDTIPLQSMQAAIDQQRRLYLRPRNYPVSAVSALSLETVAGQSLPLDPTQAIIDSLRASVYVPLLQALSGSGGGSGSWSYVVGTNNVDRNLAGEVIISYTAGFAYAAMPIDVQDACILYVSAELSKRQNPAGFAEVQMGKRHIMSYLRGDTSGVTSLVKEADRLLEQGNYVRKAW